MTINDLINATSDLLEHTVREDTIPCWDRGLCDPVRDKIHYSFPLHAATKRLCPACLANHLVSVARNQMITCARFAADERARAGVPHETEVKP